VHASGGGLARRDDVARDVMRMARSARLKFRLALFEPIFLQIFELQ
jgi:hypothetical protein